MSIHELASIMLAKQPAVTQLVGLMEDAANDKRQSQVSLKAAGRRKVQPLLRLTHQQLLLCSFRQVNIWRYWATKSSVSNWA